jgi:protein-S-isoprenylcysteine O-methyltransferase Ste14
MNLWKSILHNLGVVIVGFGVALLGTGLDAAFGLERLQFALAAGGGGLLVGLGFLLRVWATDLFYENRMRVIQLSPQATLITSGPYRFSRNPLYLGGNVLVFFGAALVLGSPMALLLTLLHLPVVDRLIRREERQLEQTFGEDWRRYRARVRRWI